MKLWQDKPYYSFSFMLKERFHEKIYKVALNGGMTCPNRDGTLGEQGCIFCSAGGSGDFAGDGKESIYQQIEQQKKLLSNKRTAGKYIAYFQAYTNTYGSLEHLRSIYTQALEHPDIVAISIGTRPDCFTPETFALLEELNAKKPIWIELGLQTIHESTEKYIRRGYPLCVFESTLKELRKRKLEVIVHTILGLPNETLEDMLQTIEYLNGKDIQGIKLQLLHVLEHTDLALDYRANHFKVLSKDEYLQWVIACLTHLSPDIVIHRVTGDGPKELLIAPTWSSAKRSVLNDLHRTMKTLDVWQGKEYTPSKES